MSYQQYMNMGFGPPGGAHPYMMGFQPGMQMQMPPNPAQYAAPNHVRAPAPVPPAAHGGTAAVHRPPVPQQHTPVKRPAIPGKRKMNTDPNRPKRPTSAYFFFVQVEREDAARRGEKITRVAEWTKQVSLKWRELTLEQKETYQKMAISDKARYTSQMAAYTGKDANRPKRPQSAYFLWLAGFRARMKDKFAENKDILRAAGEEWRRMTVAEKGPYEQLAEEERRKYEQSMKEYNLAGGSAAAKKQRVEDAQRDARSAAAAVSQSMVALHSMHASEQQRQPQQPQMLPPDVKPSPQQLHAQMMQQLPPQLQQLQQQIQQQQLQLQQHLQQQMQQQQQLQQQGAPQPGQHNSSGEFDDGDDDDEDDDEDDEDGEFEDGQNNYS